MTARDGWDAATDGVDRLAGGDPADRLSYLAETVLEVSEKGYFAAKEMGASDAEALQAVIGMWTRYAAERDGVRATWEARAQAIEDALDSQQNGGE